MVLWVQESSISIEVESGRKRRQMACPYLSKKLKDVSSTGWIFVHAGLGDLVKAEEGGGRGGREEERGRERKREEERGRERKREEGRGKGVHERERRSSLNFLCEGSEECCRCWPFCPGSNGHFIDPGAAIWRFSLSLSLFLSFSLSIFLLGSLFLLSLFPDLLLFLPFSRFCFFLRFVWSMNVSERERD